jgi:hypothetical protein
MVRSPSPRVAQEYHHKINQVVGAKPGAGKTHTLSDGGNETKLGKNMSHNGYLAQPVISVDGTDASTIWTFTDAGV